MVLNLRRYFKAKEVNPAILTQDMLGDCLGIVNITDSLQSLDDDEVMKFTNSDLNNTEFSRTLNNKGENFLTEPGLYGLILVSRKPNKEEVCD